MITRTDVLAGLERGAKAGFLIGQKGYTPKRAAFCRDVPSDGAFELYVDQGAVPFPAQVGGQSGSSTDARTGAPVVGGVHEGGPIVVLGGNQRSQIVYNNDWDIPIGIYHNAIEDNNVGSLEDWARSCAWRFEQHKDFLAFDALNQGATNTYGKAYDDVVFISASHFDKNAEYQTVQSNSNALALSLDNFETVKVAGSKIKDDRGQPLGLDHRLLIHAADLERTAAQITDNREDYGTTNRAMNPYSGSTRRLAAPGGYLDTTAWFMVDDSDPTQKPVKLQIRKVPDLVFWDDHSQGMGIRYYKWLARYAISYSDWRRLLQGNT